MKGDRSTPLPTTVPFWLKLLSCFSLLLMTTFIKSLHMLTILPTLGPLCLKLQIHIRLTVSVPVLRLWVHCPGACYPRRVLLMGQQVLS